MVKDLTTTTEVEDRYLKFGDKFILNYSAAYKYETPYKGPFVIMRCFNNGAVKLKYGATKSRYNIRLINPYKSDTNVKYISSKNMYEYVNI